jgi:hypothetical protein
MHALRTTSNRPLERGRTGSCEPRKQSRPGTLQYQRVPRRTSAIRPIFLRPRRLSWCYKRPFSMGLFFWQALIGSRARS